MAGADPRTLDPTPPDISVVIGVRNAIDSLETTLASLFSHQGVSLEVVVVDDGSSDGTLALLQQLAAREPRLRPLAQPPRGLTAALIHGCAAARGRYLARQDAGDRSLPGRLAKQLACLEANPEASLCSTHARCTVEQDITLEIRAVPQERLQDGLTGPAFHGSVLMRRSAYIQVGGYRPMFYYAQDLDLWSRLVEQGPHLVVPEVLYQAGIAAGSISGSRRREQERYRRLIVAATDARRHDRSERPWLRRAERLAEHCRRSTAPHARRLAEGNYFIGSCLMSSHPDLARRYLQTCLEHNPLHWRARLKLARLP
ncbi:MAG: glycosyltransferase family A protein [Synechococcaceae cyanobacterium]|nr:glycosyltransferase family A protein [Synechococcaceae cyanobacterium]